MASTPTTAPAAINRLEGPQARRRHHSSNTTLSGASTTTTKDTPEPGWARRVKDAAWNTLLGVGRRTGYLEKKPRWVSETLAYSSHTSSDADDFVDEDLHWLSGDDPDDPRLALILVEKDPTQFQTASLNALQNAGNVSSKPVFHPGDSQDNLVNANHHPNHRLKALYMRGFGPEQTRVSPIDTERGLDSLVGEIRRVSFFRACKRYFDRFCFPEFNDPSVEAVYKDDTYRTSKVRSFATFCRYRAAVFPIHLLGAWRRFTRRVYRIHKAISECRPRPLLSSQILTSLSLVPLLHMLHRLACQLDSWHHPAHSRQPL